MSAASKFYPFDRTNVFYNLQDWESMLGRIVESNPEAADSISQVLFEIVSTLQERGRFLETIDTVKLGLEWIFPYTSAYSLSFSLFLFEADGALGESEGLETLLTAALDRAYAKESTRAGESKKSLGAGKSRSRGEKAKPDRVKKSRNVKQRGVRD